MKKLISKLIETPLSLKNEEAEKLLIMLREEVNSLDKEIAELLVKRVEISLHIARVKRLLKIPSYSPEREKKIIDNVLSAAHDVISKKIIKSIYERVIDESRGLQKMSQDDEPAK